MVCFSYRTFGLVGIRFLHTCMQFLDCVNKEKFFLSVSDIVFRARCIACVSVVSLELNFVSDADFVCFLVVAAISNLCIYFRRLHYISPVKPELVSCFSKDQYGKSLFQYSEVPKWVL